MAKKDKFLEYVNKLMEAAPDVPMSDEAKVYWEAFQKTKDSGDKPLFTDNGKLILRFLQERQDIDMWKSKDIAEEMFISSRTVSGAMRKLVTDGYVEKVGTEPVIYSITQKGKDIKII